MEVWEERQLINFSYSSPANFIPLCPNCYAQYTNSTDPGFVFFPTDLNFFIEYELRDRQRRRQQGGIRKAPSANDYKDHQVREHKMSPLELGGLYRPVFLKEYLLGGRMPMEVLQKMVSDKAWHGDPIATLRRAMAVLGSARVGILDTNTIRQLRQLQELYFSDYASDSRLSFVYQRKTSEKRPHDDLDNEDERQHKRRSFLQDSTSDASHKGPASDHSDKPQSPNVSDTSAWVLGPQSSTNETIERFAPVFANTNMVNLLSK